MSQLEVIFQPDRTREKELEKELAELKILYFEALSSLQAAQMLAEGLVGHKGNHDEKKAIAAAMAQSLHSTLSRLKKKIPLDTSRYYRFLSNLRYGEDCEF